jgi:hypothetical protein
LGPEFAGPFAAAVAEANRSSCRLRRSPFDHALNRIGVVFLASLVEQAGLNPLSPPHPEHIGSGVIAIGRPSATCANDTLADTQSSRFRRHHGQLELQTSAAFTAGNTGKVFRHEVLGAEALD